MKQTKGLRTLFVADVLDAIRDVKQLDEAIEQTGQSADKAQGQLADVGDGAEDSARKTREAFQKLYVLTERQAEDMRQEYRDAYEQIANSGEASAEEIQRAYVSMQKGIARVNDKIERDTDSTFDRMVNNIGTKLRSVGTRITTTVTAAVTAAATGGVVAMQGLNQKIIDTANAADVAGVSMREFQRWSSAAATVGVEFEDMSQMLKDMSDRIGDLGTAEGGPLVDWMERVAPKIGLVSKSIVGDSEAMAAATKRLFGQLSSTEALQLYVSGIEKASASGHDFRFLLEAIAGDSTKLLPLLRNNGKELNRLADIAERDGSFFDAEDVKRARELQAANAELARAFQALGIALMEAGVHKTLVDMIKAVAEFVRWITENVNPAVLKWGTILTAVALALGPILIGISMIVIAFSAVSGAVLLVIAKIALIVAAVAAIAAAIWSVREVIVNAFSDAIRFVRDNFVAAFDYIGKAAINYLLGPLRAGMKMVNFIMRAMRMKQFKVPGYDLPGFYDGGYTGDLPENKVAGVTHGQEVVIRASSVRKWGRAALESLNRGVLPQSLASRLSPVSGRGGQSGTPVIVQIGGEQFPMSADEDVVRRFEKSARSSARRRSSAVPGFVGA